MARPGLTTHPKFRRLMHEASLSRSQAWGHLECLWEPAYASGNPVIGDAVDVEIAADWHGEPGRLCAALVRCGFLDRQADEQYAIHDLHSNAPEYVRTRWQKEQSRADARICSVCQANFRSGEPHAKYCSRACRQRAYKLREVTQSDGVGDAQVTQSDGVGDAQVTHGDEAVTKSDAAPSPAQPSPVNTPLPPEGASSLASRFDEFWEKFPGDRKADKAGCRKLWMKRKLDHIADEIFAGLERWLVSDDWAKEGRKYVHGPHPWLNKSKWEAHPVPVEGEIVDMTPAEAQALWEAAQ